MHVIFVIGRVLLVAIFIVHGAGKLIDIPGAAAPIAGKVTVPAPLTDVVTQLTDSTGMPVEQLMVAAAGVFELLGGLLIAFGIGTRGVALVLFLYTLAATFYLTYYLNDFGKMTGIVRDNALLYTEKNVAVMGGLLMLFAIGNWFSVRRRNDVVV